jgi:hypothetical protein
MQKIFIITLMFIYLTLSVGLNIIVHTCGGKSETILAASTVEDPCGCGDMMPDDRCCTTEVTTVKLNDDQKTVVTSLEKQLSVNTITYPALTTQRPAAGTEQTTIFISSFSPPPNTDLTIINSVFLI